MTSRGVTAKGLVFGLAGVMLAVVAIVAIRASLSDASGAESAGPAPSLPAPAGTASPTGAGLGVFEPIRGWIVYPIDDGLKAVNPADPAERRTLELPAGLDVLLRGLADGATRPVPAGWSADGRKLALSHEYSGDYFVMTADGTITRENLGPSGCCLFNAEPWLSPDGTTGLEGVGPNGIRYVNLALDHHLVRRLEPPVAAGRSSGHAVWSTDGSRVAFVTVRDQTWTEPTLYVADFSTGANHPVADLDAGHVRHIVWSPDDSQLLMVAGAPLPPGIPSLNPLVHGQATRLLLVDTDGSGSREVGSGYYVAAAWSPDATQLAAIEYDGARRSLVVMNVDGTGKRVLVELPAGELFTGVAWHPLPDRD